MEQRTDRTNNWQLLIILIVHQNLIIFHNCKICNEIKHKLCIMDNFTAYFYPINTFLYLSKNNVWACSI